MAAVYIAEFVSVAGTGNFTVAGALVAPVAEQTLSIGGGSVPSAAFNTRTKFVRIHTDAICSLAWGLNPTATITNMRMAANQTEYFGVPEAGSYKVAVISNT